MLSFLLCRCSNELDLFDFSGINEELDLSIIFVLMFINTLKSEDFSFSIYPKSNLYIP